MSEKILVIYAPLGSPQGCTAGAFVGGSDEDRSVAETLLLVGWECYFESGDDLASDFLMRGNASSMLPSNTSARRCTSHVHR